MNKKLYRDEYHKVFGGVCSGLAEYFDIDVTLVRLIFVFSFFAMGTSLFAYIVLWIILPKKGYVYPGYNNPFVDYRVPPQQNNDNTNVPPYSGSNPFANVKYDFSAPVNFPQIKQSNAGIITGTVLIVLGAIFLAGEYDIIPDFEWDRLWPIVLVLIGAGLIASGQIKKPWEKENWHKTGTIESEANTQTEDSSVI